MKAYQERKIKRSTHTARSYSRTAQTRRTVAKTQSSKGGCACGKAKSRIRSR